MDKLNDDQLDECEEVCDHLIEELFADGVHHDTVKQWIVSAYMRGIKSASGQERA